MTLCPNTLFIRLWRLCTCMLILWAQWIRFPSGDSWRHFVYYTNQTNIMALVLCAWLFCSVARPSHFCKMPPAWLHAGVSFWLFTTMCVYWSVLFRPASSDLTANGLTLSLFAGYTLHALSPVMILLDWIFFVPHGRLRISHAFEWLSYPLCYCVWIYLRAELGPRLSENSRYPYPFMDIDLLSSGQLAAYGVTFFAGFLLLALLFVGLDWGIKTLMLQRDNNFGISL